MVHPKIGLLEMPEIPALEKKTSIFQVNKIRLKTLVGFHWTNDLPNLGRFEMFVSFVLFGAFAVAVFGEGVSSAT